MKKILTGLALSTVITFGSMAIAHEEHGAGAADTPYAEMPAGAYELDKTHASLIWKVSHLGLSNYTARFTRFDADLNFDSAKPEMSTLVVTVDPTSIETDYPFSDTKNFDEKLSTSGDWFNSGKFPKITFTSTSITRSGNTGVITGDLDFLGVKKAIDLNVTFNGAFAKNPFSQKPALGFSATTKINRSDWGFSTYVPNIGDEVEIIIEVEFAKK